MPRAAQTLDNHIGFNPPPLKMDFSSPKPLPFKSPGACSTPESSGTFSSARTIKYESDKNKNKERFDLNYKCALLKQKPSVGGLVEAVADVRLKKPGGDHRRQAGGDDVQLDQTSSWEDQKMSTKSFYGSSTSSLEWNSQITVKERPNKANTTKKELIDKINRRSKMNPQAPGFEDNDDHVGKNPPPYNFGSASIDLNLCNNIVMAEPHRSVAEDSDCEMVTSSSSREFPSPLPPPLKPPTILQPHKIGFKVCLDVLLLLFYFHGIMQNYGNTCYINACMQSMLGLETVVTDIMNAREILLCTKGT